MSEIRRGGVITVGIPNLKPITKLKPWQLVKRYRRWQARRNIYEIPR